MKDGAAVAAPRVRAVLGRADRPVPEECRAEDQRHHDQTGHNQAGPRQRTLLSDEEWIRPGAWVDRKVTLRPDGKTEGNARRRSTQGRAPPPRRSGAQGPQ